METTNNIAVAGSARDIIIKKTSTFENNLLVDSPSKKTVTFNNYEGPSPLILMENSGDEISLARQDSETKPKIHNHSDQNINTNPGQRETAA